MKTKMIMMAILLGIATLFYSCSKNTDVMEIKHSRLNNVMLMPVLGEHLGPSNPENSYDSIGVWHNEILDYIHANRMDKTRPMTEQEIAGMVNEFSINRWGYGQPDLPMATTSWKETDGIQAYLDELVNRSELSDYGKQHLNRLLSVVNQQLSLQADFSYATFKTIVLEMEMQFATDALLTADDSRKLQMAASVARHSTWYWTQIDNIPPVQSEPVAPDNTARISFKNIIQKVATITSDIGGAVTGYVGGGLRQAAGKAAKDSEWMYHYIGYAMP